jgi:predicted metalloprotease with PDZ domain
MYPYDFTKENYSKLGYICEGITTYQGDLFLLKSGVFNDEQYFLELNQQFQKHFDNAGRFNYSVAESSFDTWLDGYQVGAPGRKVSIYTEGCLLAFVMDVKILKATNNKLGLDEVMKRLYFNFAVNNLGISEDDYKSVLENITGENQDDFFNEYVNGCRPYESIIVESLEYLGLELIHTPSTVYSEGKLGFKVASNGVSNLVAAMYPGSPAEIGGLMLGDDVIAVNGIVCKDNLQKWLTYFENETKELTIIRSGKLVELTLPEVNRHFYMEYKVGKMASPNNLQIKAFEAWKK